MMKIAIECNKIGTSKKEFISLAREIWSQVDRMKIEKSEQILDKIMKTGLENLMSKKNDLVDK